MFFKDYFTELCYKWPSLLFQGDFNEAQWEYLFTYTWPHVAVYLDLLFNLVWQNLHEKKEVLAFLSDP